MFWIIRNGCMNNIPVSHISTKYVIFGFQPRFSLRVVLAVTNDRI